MHVCTRTDTPVLPIVVSLAHLSCCPSFIHGIKIVSILLLNHKQKCLLNVDADMFKFPENVKDTKKFQTDSLLHKKERNK